MNLIQAITIINQAGLVYNEIYNVITRVGDGSGQPIAQYADAYTEAARTLVKERGARIAPQPLPIGTCFYSERLGRNLGLYDCKESLDYSLSFHCFYPDRETGKCVDRVVVIDCKTDLQPPRRAHWSYPILMAEWQAARFQPWEILSEITNHVREISLADMKPAEPTKEEESEAWKNLFNPPKK